MTTTRRPGWGRTMARTGLRMMPTSPSSPLKFRAAGFPRDGFKAGLSGGPAHATSTRHAAQLTSTLRAPRLQTARLRSVPEAVARLSTAMRAATAALPPGPSLRAGLCCPSPSSLTPPHPPHSRAHRDFAACRFIRDAFAVPWPRRPASGSVLSLHVLCRHATLYRPRGVRRLHTPSSLTGDAGLHTTLIVRHSQVPHKSASRGPVISGLHRFTLAAACRLACLPWRIRPGFAPSRRRRLHPGFRRVGHPLRRRV